MISMLIKRFFFTVLVLILSVFPLYAGSLLKYSIDEKNNAVGWSPLAEEGHAIDRKVMFKNQPSLKISMNADTKKALKFGWSISGEHGIGKIKREYLKIMYSQKELDEMRQIKRTLDPSLILNCGNIVSFKTVEE